MEEERNKIDKINKDSLKVVNLHAMMKKTRVEEVENILKENTDLKYSLEKIREELELRVSPINHLHSRIKDLEADK